MHVTRILYSRIHFLAEQGVFRVTKSGLKSLLPHFGEMF